MERRIAVRRLHKMLGKDFGYQIHDDAPSPEEREEARARLPELQAARDAATKALEARLKLILDGDAEYQRLKAASKEAREALSRESGKLHHFKISVGTANNLFFHVAAQGDSWEEIFAKLAKDNGHE